jgi:hypothetical protein
MHHPILFLLGLFLAARLFFRMRMRRWHRYGYGGCGGGCHRRFGRPIDLGAPDEEPRFPPWGRRARAWRRWQERNEAMVKAPQPAVDVVGSLELNQRQRELYDEAIDKAKAKLAVAELAEALALVGRDPYDRDAVEFLVGKGELADDLEHLHFSLTAEQRAKLRAVVSA